MRNHESTNPEHVRIAYITSHYPIVSHTFVQREVTELRKLGAEIHTYSVHKSNEQDVLSKSDQDAFESTEALLPVSVSKLARAHFRALRHSPSAYAKTLMFGLRRGGLDPKRALWQLFYFAEAILLWQSCDNKNIRHVHAHLANVAADVARLTAVFGQEQGEHWAWSFTMHGSAELYDVEGYGLRSKIRDADFIVCVSTFGRSQLLALTDESQLKKMTLVHCGVDTNNFSPQHSKQDNDAFRVLCVARLVQGKGQGVLINAIARLRDQGIPVELTLVGSGPSETYLKDMAQHLGLQDRVTFTGAVGQDDIRSYYANADVFCLPSAAEGIPIVLMEAMASEIPVVSTYVGGIPELVENGVSGLLVPPGNADTLAAALLSLTQDADMRANMAKMGREQVVADFNVQRCAIQLLEVFDQKLSAAK